MIDESGVKPFCLSGRGRLGERRAVAACAIAVERELRDDEDLPADIPHGAVHLALIVVKDAQVAYFLGQVSRFAGIICFGDANKDA